MLVRRIDHTAIYVSDLDRSVGWYSRTFGLTCAYQGDTGGGVQGAFFDVGDTILAVLQSESPTHDLSEQHFAFAVDEVDAAYADLRSRGYTFELDPLDLPEGYIAGQRYCDLLDPDGVRVELVQRRNISINPFTLHPEATEAVR